ncbi:MAG: hypothetical protein JW920_04575 [Deltaproteobacteria bacterium]|nr:hypothetical protein [Deltaproteobacteria bacterium]
MARMTGLISVQGIIIPADWDEHGEVITIAVSTHKEQEFLLENNRKGDELKDFVGLEMILSGFISTKDGKDFLHVENFSRIERKDD